MNNIRRLITDADFDGIREALEENPSLANEDLPYDIHNQAKAHPLHRIADGVMSGNYSDEDAIRMAKIFLKFAAAINGNVTEVKKDTPLVAAASLNAEQLGIFYIDSGANIHHPGCHGGTALHWAAWCGKDLLVKKLITAGAEINKLCIDFKSTPLFWAAHGFNSSDKKDVGHYAACIQSLLDAGADKSIPNADGKTVAVLLKQEPELYKLLQLQ